MLWLPPSPRTLNYRAPSGRLRTEELPERELASLQEVERGGSSGGELGRAAGELVHAKQHAFQNKLAAENKDYSRGIPP